jgi:gamma-glutamylcyclotransferase (GGCT)/AIG2-like uncharacterized protein YtfP
MNKKIFVYGSLLRGMIRNDALEDSEFLGLAYCNGELKDLGSFPALIPGKEKVIGEVYTASSKIISILDQIEGYNTNDEIGSLYIRKELPVRLFSSGKWIDAQTYFMPRDVDDYPTIESGDYRRYILSQNEKTIYYLSFGSNLSTDRLRERIGRWGKVVRGYLPDFRLIYNKRSSIDDGFAFANLTVAEKGKDCRCAAYEVDEQAIHELDYWEGVLSSSSHYVRTVLPMKTEKGEGLMGFVYIAHPDQLIRNGKPSPAYREYLLQGYYDHGLGKLEDYECTDA